MHCNIKIGTAGSRLTVQNITVSGTCHLWPLKLSDEQLLKHFNGEQQISIYPLLPGNTSWFIAADFDEENWIGECRRFLQICNENNLPAYFERSNYCGVVLLLTDTKA